MLEKKPTVELLLTWLEQEVASKPGLKKGLVGLLDILKKRNIEQNVYGHVKGDH